MKTKLTRVLGVVMTVALLASMLVSAAPVSAGTQAWSKIATPSTTGMVLSTNATNGVMVQGSDGTVWSATATGLVKSANFGQTWVPVTTYTGGTIVDMVVSSIDANTVYVTNGTAIFKTTDAGTTWVTLSALTLAAAEAITSIDVGFIGTSPYIFVSTAGNAVFGGDVYVAQEAVFGMPWTDMNVATDRAVALGAIIGVSEVMVDPANFGTSQMVLAVVNDISNTKTVLTTKYSGAQWGATVADVALTGVTANITSTSTWLPDDFSSSLASGTMQCFVGVNSVTAAQNDVFLVVFGAPAGASYDLNSVAGGFSVVSLDGVGNGGSAQLLATATNAGAPMVIASTNGGANWVPNAKRPTGATAGSVLINNGGTDAIVSTSGADCGVSISSDWSVWNTISLINTTIGTINEIEGGETTYMSTSVGAADTASSMWRLDGTTWVRILSDTLYGMSSAPNSYDFDVIEVVDGAIFTCDLNTVIADSAIWRSTNGGQTWAVQVSTSVALTQSMVALDANTVLVGGTNNVYQTTNNGVIWFTRPCAVGAITSMDVDAATGDILAAGITGGVGVIAISSNNGTSWTVSTNTVALDTSIIAIFAESYATSGQIFATGTDSGVNAGVWTRTTGAWSRIDTGGNPQDVNAGTGLVSTAGLGAVDMVYAADAAATEGVTRIMASATVGNVAEQMAGPAATTFAGLWAGGNTLYTVDTATASVYTYTDTLAVAGTGVTVSAVTTTTATVTWDALANATTYKVVVNTVEQVKSYTAANAAGVAVVITGTSAAITGLNPVTAYYVSVWANTPVTSFIFSGGGVAFNTNPTAPAAAPSLIPVNGATGVSLTPSMAWAPVAGAVSYEIQYGTDPTFTTVTTATSDVAFFTITTELDYDANIYWRVRAVTATGGTSAWVASVFTTMVEPTAPVDVTTTDPNIVVNIPSDDATPAYIWGIIAIGAVLTIAVIILIVRTRRVV